METYSTILIVACLFGASVFGNKDERSILVNRRFILTQNSSKVWSTLEQFAACSLKCVPGYEKLSEVCCNTGLDVVCSNLPWDVLKASLGHCSDNSSANIPTVATAWVSLEQFAACSLTCVHGYEKLAEVCCLTGIKDVCSNLPWDFLKPFLKTCDKSSSQVSQEKNTSTTKPITTRVTTIPSTYWLPWGGWQCLVRDGGCNRVRRRNCSTGNDIDCVGVDYSIEKCSPITCPDQYTTIASTSKTTSSPTTSKDTCQDDADAHACNDPALLKVVCTDTQFAWRFCPSSCNMCDTCWDYLNCSSAGAKQLYCGRESYAVQYCRKTCGKCAHKPVPVTVNKCGDPVANELICELLQSELCICNDPDVRDLCQNYCNNRCTTKVTNTSCSPVSGRRRRRRGAILEKMIFSY